MILITTREVAAKLGFSTRHVCRLVNENKLTPFAVLDNGHNVFTSDAVDTFKEKRTARKEAKNAN